MAVAADLPEASMSQFSIRAETKLVRWLDEVAEREHLRRTDVVRRILWAEYDQAQSTDNPASAELSA
jgi:hypothetical protein